MRGNQKFTETPVLRALVARVTLSEEKAKHIGCP
jgi:hypothetical protein